MPLVGDVLRGVLELGDMVHKTLMYDDMGTDDPADDVAKLVDQANQPTFSTVQEFAQKLVDILGPGSPVTYDEASESLLVDLSLQRTFGSIDVPLDFNLDFAPLGDLSSEGALHLSADGELGITLGIYLGNEGAVELSTSTPLSSLKDGAISFNKDLVVAGTQDVSILYGQLSDDAVFSLIVDAAVPVEVTVAKDDTTTNATVADLASDVNAALATAGLGASVQAIVDDKRLVLRRIGDSGSLEIDVQNGTPAVTQMGFRDGQTAEDVGGQLLFGANAEVSGYVGRLTGDAVFTVTMNTANGGCPSW